MRLGRRATVAAAVAVLVATSVAGCAGEQGRNEKSHACEELKPLLTSGDRTADQTKTAVTAVHAWSSQVGDDEGFKAAGQALYTAYQTSREDEFVAAVDDLRERCRSVD